MSGPLRGAAPVPGQLEEALQHPGVCSATLSRYIAAAGINHPIVPHRLRHFLFTISTVVWGELSGERHGGC